VPFFLHWPAGGLTQGRDVAELTANVDVMPTLMELCGIEPQGHSFDGRSLVPLLSGERVDWPDRTMVTDSQRIARPIKWRKSSTMTNRWRLINGVELYDMLTDPGQRQDVASEHPEAVAALREGYEAWWDKVSQQFDSTIPITIGTDQVGSVLLNSHDWRNDPVACAWNQSLVRAGLECNGFWEIEVAASGHYRFELRRWPREEGRPIVEGIPGELVSYRDIKTGYGGGRAIPLVTARIQVAGYEDTRCIAADDKSIVFTFDLDAGETRLQTYLSDADGNTIGAYYVYVQRLPQV
jgi:hypothetical protein